jgi:guanylate kinase
VFSVPPAALEELRAKANGTQARRLIVLSAPSGTGKDAILARLRERNRDVHVVVTCTTRARRPGEIDGEHYRFVTDTDFLAMRARGELLEDAQYAEHQYGVPADEVRQAVARGQDVILKVEVHGGSIVKLQVPGTVLVFLAPPTVEELENRLRRAQGERGNPSETDLQNRLALARRELACIPGYDYLVVNHPGRMEQAVEQIEAIIRAERCRVNVPPVRV